MVEVVAVWRAKASGAGMTQQAVSIQKATFGVLGFEEGFWEQTGHRQTSTSRVSGFRGPQQGSSQARFSPSLETDTLALRPKPDDHTTE
ncbi:hypothetical protein PBY51_013936 [Eleginops maclovinus]|uniref:Uncharacterized protein n=1 Tax=Eleginops maclovinus TaxID=56733 RepID=A0AAN7WVY1_ELEMC|nr:hypothetical protein PBY51_013936 [Eleginops maclovinus]